MDGNEKAQELMTRAEKLGVRLEFGCGFLVAVKRTAPAEPEKVDPFIAEVLRYLPHVRLLAEQRAIAARAKELFGQRIFCDRGEGVLTDASSNGLVGISVIQAGASGPLTMSYKAESLLIVLGEEADGAPAPRNDQPTSDVTRKGIFELFRRGPGKD